MTPRRRQGTGRAAFDHISQQLTESLSTLSKVTASQAAIAAVVAQDDAALTRILERLDGPLLAAIRDAAFQLYDRARAEDDWRSDATEGTSP